jgi:ABC-type phosphate transport system substrate-binding protein
MNLVRKLPAVLPALLGLVCLCGCGVSTRGAERAVPTVDAQAPKVSSPAALRLAHRAPGTLVVAGSPQESLTASAARAYRAHGGSDTVTLKDAGTATAFSQLCRGQIDMVDSSSPISSTELAQCERAGIRPVQLQVASDAIVLATKTGTDVGADCLTAGQVKTIFRAGSPVTNWGQLGFDQVALSVAGPGPRDNAFGFFGRDVLGSTQPSLLDFRYDYHAESTDQPIREFVTGGSADAAAASGLTQLRQTASTMDAILAGAQKTLTGANGYVTEAARQVTQGVADGRPLATQQLDATNLAAAQAKQKRAQAAVAKETAALGTVHRQMVTARAAQSRLGADVGHLGMFRFSYYGMFEDVLRPLEISSAASPENCIFPSQDTVTSGAYPLSRPLLITTSVQDAKHADVQEFLLSYLHHAQRLAAEQGLVEIPDNVLAREEAFFGAGAQSSAAGSSSAGVSGTGTATTAALLPTVH